MKKLLILLCSVALFLILPFETSLAKEWNIQTTEDVEKTWKVNFSMELDSTTVKSSNVYVTDGKTVHPTKLQIINGGKTIEVQPSEAYEMNTEYELIVTKDVKNLSGQPLQESVEMPFKVVDSSVVIQSVNSVTGSGITVLTVVTNSDVFDVKISSESLKYKGNNTYEHVLFGKEPGDSITIYAYDENDKVIEKQTYKIGE